MKKICFKCGVEKPLDDFYKHPMMSDGYLNKCKECTKLDVKKNYSENIEYYKKYDKLRANLPHRVESRKKYQRENPDVFIRLKKRYERNHPEKVRQSKKKYLLNNPLKRAAHIAVGNAIRDGRIIKQPCRDCGKTKVEAHHEDYTNPLDVIWLCKKHHVIADKIRKERLKVSTICIYGN